MVVDMIFYEPFFAKVHVQVQSEKSAPTTMKTCLRLLEWDSGVKMKTHQNEKSLFYWDERCRCNGIRFDKL